MTVSEAIAAADKARRGNVVSETEKIKWLSDLDGIIKRDVIDTHSLGKTVNFKEYDENTPMDTVLIVPEPYSGLYVSYILAQIDMYSGDFNKYNNNMSMFESMYQKYADFINRTNATSGLRQIRW